MTQLDSSLPRIDVVHASLPFTVLKLVEIVERSYEFNVTNVVHASLPFTVLKPGRWLNRKIDQASD